MRIAPTLKELGILDSVYFGLDRYSSVNSTIHRISTETGKRFQMKKVLDGIKVTRIA